MNDFGKAVRDRPREAGGAFLRHCKGDHDVWTMADGKRVVVPFRIKSRHTAKIMPGQVKVPT